jgi:hypothetical protein
MSLFKTTTENPAISQESEKVRTHHYSKHLQEMRLSVKKTGNSEHTSKMLMFTIMYVAWLRISEVTQPNGKGTKHDTNKENVTLNHKNQEIALKLDTCIFSKKHVTMTVSEGGETSSHAKALEYNDCAGSLHNQNAARKQLNKALAGIGVKPSEYSKHRFRIVKTTNMWKQGYTDQEL